MKPTSDNTGAEAHGARGTDPRSGAILAIMMIVLVVLTIFGAGLLKLGDADARDSSSGLNAEQSFWLAEAGIQRLIERLHRGNSDSIGTTAMGNGAYRVDVYPSADPPYADAVGMVGDHARGVRVTWEFLATPFEDAIWAGNKSGGSWDLQLSGVGSPDANDEGGRDEVHGNLFVDGNVVLRGDSMVAPAPPPNTYNRDGDVNATGAITVRDSATIAGASNSGVAPQAQPDLLAMDYPNNNTHDIAQIFDDFGITSGRLPSGHPLYDVVVKNPGNRATECASTPEDDFFFEPASVSNLGASSKQARTPLDLGTDRVYYVDGHVWFHNQITYGFRIDGQATLVSTGDIHVSDNLKYNDDQDLLGLIALGEYDLLGNLIDGGNVYFGDPRFGTLYAADAFMFAANDFRYNTDSTSGEAREPETGFEVFGNFAAQDQVLVYRDWYDAQADPPVWVDGHWERVGWRWVWIDGHWQTEPHPAQYDEAAGQWVDALDGSVLDSEESDSLRHYQMIVKYDERIWDPDTQPPGLPKGGSTVFGGIDHWERI